MSLFNRNLIWRTAAVTLLLLATSTMLYAAKPDKPGGGGKTLSCTISPETSTINVGQSIVFSATTSGLKGSKTYVWTFENGTPGASTDSSVSVIYNSQGSFDVSLIVSGRNGSTTPCSASVKVNTVENQPPTAKANGTYTGITDVAVSFSSAGSSDADGSIVAYEWDFGDGSAINTDANPDHIYKEAATYNVSLTVTDDKGATDSELTTATIAVGNQPPIANTNGPYTGTTGVAVSFSSAGSNDPEGTISYEWDFGDGNNSTQAHPAHAYTDAGTYSVTLTVTDNDGAKGTDTTFATVTVSGNEGKDHSNIEYDGPGTCLDCHATEAHDVFGSTHYQWKGLGPDMVNQPEGPDPLQGKHAGAVNTYCGNITGNWNGCSSCHVGLGAQPEATVSPAQLENIDCLVCHQEGYKRKKENGVMVPDLAKMVMDMDEAVRTVHKPTRANCLQCHAKAGGGDALKRGDLSLATADTNDFHYDIHMSRTGADLVCQDCHVPADHRFPGKGSDLRPTDLDVVLECGNSGCHSQTPHDDSHLNRHTEKVACQTCHIPVYAKNADDSDASEATETNRSWKAGSDHKSAPFHPVLTKANNLTPVYLHWNRASDNYLLGDVISPNLLTGTYQTSVPQGSADDPASKLYPFKYKTSDYPLHSAEDKLIALDTSVFFATADADAAVKSGLDNMGYDAEDAYKWVTWVTTDTYQLLNHQVSPHDDALDCQACHLNTARMDLQGDLGYAPKTTDKNSCGSNCHDGEKANSWDFGDWEDFEEYHKGHAEKKKDCSECHNFSRN